MCVERGYHRLEWWVLDWNAPSIAFYEALGAAPQDEWTRYRLDGGPLAALAGPETGDPALGDPAPANLSTANLSTANPSTPGADSA